MRICDCHAHIGSFHDNISGKYVECGENSLLSQMDEAGVDVAVVSHLGALSNPIRANCDMLIAAERHPKRFVPLAWVAPAQVSSDNLRKMLAGGFKGLKLHPTECKFRADCSEVVGYLKICSDLGMPALIHCAADGWSAPNIVAAATRAAGPDVRVIAAHMNLMGDADEAIRAAEQTPNMYLDTSWVRPDSVLSAVRRLGASRVLWGTDAPLAGPAGGHYAADQARTAILRNLPPHEAEMVLWGNARKLFDIDIGEVQ